MVGKIGGGNLQDLEQVVKKAAKQHGKQQPKWGGDEKNTKKKGEKSKNTKDEKKDKSQKGAVKKGGCGCSNIVQPR